MFFKSQPTSIGNVYLSLNLPKLRLFSTVHLAVDDQDIREASDVASLHLKRCKMHNFNTWGKGTSCCCCVSVMRRWDSLWADTSHSFHTTPGCSAPDRCSSSRSRQSRTPLLCLTNQRIFKSISLWGCIYSLCLRHTTDKDAWNPTLRVVFRVMHGEEQRQRWAHRLFATATQTAVLHLTSEQFPDDRLTRGTERTEPQAHKEMTSSPVLLMLSLGVCSRLLPTCCWLLCRPEGLPVPVSLGGAGPGWSGSSFGLNGPVWPCPFAHPSQRGSDPVPRLQGWFETPAGSYWPLRGGTGGSGQKGTAAT